MPDNEIQMGPKLRHYRDLAVTTEGFDPDVTWTPVINMTNGCVGYKVESLASDDVQYIFLNPSSGSDEPGHKSDVFVYTGEVPDPAEGMPLHFYTPDFEDFAWQGENTYDRIVKVIDDAKTSGNEDTDFYAQQIEDIVRGKR